MFLHNRLTVNNVAYVSCPMFVSLLSSVLALRNAQTQEFETMKMP